MNLIPKSLGQWALKKLARAAGFDAPDASGALKIAGGPLSNSGKWVTESTAVKISAAWCCVRVLTETLGSLPWALYERNASGSVGEVKTHNLSALLTQPNDEMTSVEFREALMFNLVLHGMTYSQIDRLAGQPVSLVPVRAPSMRPMRQRNTGALYYEKTEDNGVKTPLSSAQVWCVRGFGSNGTTGLSPLEAATDTMGLALAAEDFGSRFFRQGAVPSGVVTVPQWLKEDERKLARDRLQEVTAGLANSHTMALFEGGMKPEPWKTMALDELQFVALREFSVEDICRFFRVPPHMVADLRRTNYNSAEQLSLEFVKFSLMPYFTRFESSFARWLMTPQERTKMFLKFKFEGLLRADSKGRSEFYASAVQNGWMSRSEVREKEDLNPVAGLDEFTAGTNLAPVDMLGDVAMKRPTAPQTQS